MNHANNFRYLVVKIGVVEMFWNLNVMSSADLNRGSAISDAKAPLKG